MLFALDTVRVPVLILISSASASDPLVIEIWWNILVPYQTNVKNGIIYMKIAKSLNDFCILNH